MLMQSTLCHPVLGFGGFIVHVFVGGGGVHHFYQVSWLSLYGQTGVLGSGSSPLVRPTVQARGASLCCPSTSAIRTFGQNLARCPRTTLEVGWWLRGFCFRWPAPRYSFNEPVIAMLPRVLCVCLVRTVLPLSLLRKKADGLFSTLHACGLMSCFLLLAHPIVFKVRCACVRACATGADQKAMARMLYQFDLVDRA